MVDPTRKRRRELRAPELRLAATPAPPCDPLRIVTAHATRPWVLDLNEFADGTLNKVTNYPHSGVGFRGRPELVAVLAAWYRVTLATAAKKTVTSVQTALRAWWRLFDATHEVASVHCIQDISELHAVLAVRSGMQRPHIHLLLRVLNMARQSLGLPKLHFDVPKEPPRASSLPEKKAIAAIYQELKSRVRSCCDRFEAADASAAVGRILLAQRLGDASLCEADVHATYRAHLKACSKALALSAPGLSLQVRQGAPPLQCLSLPVFGLYPRKADVQAVLLLFLLKTGWNAQTALDMDVTGAWLRPHPMSEQHHIVVGLKSRGNTEQIAVGLEKSQLSPGRLVKALVDRTCALRALLASQLAAAQAQYQCDPSDEQRLVVAELRRKSKSPWLFVDHTCRNTIRALDLDTYLQSSGEGVLRKWIRGNSPLKAVIDGRAV